MHAPQVLSLSIFNAVLLVFFLSKECSSMKENYGQPASPGSPGKMAAKIVCV